MRNFFGFSTAIVLAVGSLGDVSAASLINVGSGFSNPAGIALDANGNVFVADRGNNAVKEVLATGGYVTVNTLGGGFSGPTAVAVDSSGNVFVADAGNNAIKEILAAGGYVTVNTLAGGLTGIVSIAADANGNVFFLNAAGMVEELLAAGGYTTVNTLGGGFTSAAGIAVDPNGNVFVSNQSNVKEFVAGSGYATMNSYDSVGFGSSDPLGAIAADASGNLFVAQTVPLPVFGFDGYVLELLAGNGFASYNIVYGSTPNLPTSIAVSGTGVFVVGIVPGAVSEIVPQTPVTLQEFHVD